MAPLRRESPWSLASAANHPWTCRPLHWVERGVCSARWGACREDQCRRVTCCSVRLLLLRGNAQHLQRTTVNISMSWSRQKCPQSRLMFFDMKTSRRLGSRQYQASEDCFLSSVVLCAFVPASGWRERSLPCRNGSMRSRPSDRIGFLQAPNTVPATVLLSSTSPSSLHASYGSAFVNFPDFASDMSCSLILAQCLFSCLCE